MLFRFALVACARWEEQYIQEWLLYHRAIGFEHVYLYCNDDDPTGLYQQVMPFLDGDNPFVTFVHYPFQGLQFRMYVHCLRHYRHQAEWVMFLDIDEFLVLRGVDDIARFVAGLPDDWDSITFHRINFGPNGFAERPPGSVLLQYTWRSAKVHPLTKNLTRVARIDYDYFERGGRENFWHFFSENAAPAARCVTVLGDDIRAYYADFENNALYLEDRGNGRRILDSAIIFHYGIKSEADFLRRSDRGLRGDFYAQGAWRSLLENGGVPDYLREVSAVEDRYLADFWQRHIDRVIAARVVPPPPGVNIALGRPATQSSVCDWSAGATPEEDAAQAVSGIFGGRTFHTACDDNAWWMVDLGAVASIDEIRIFNRLDHPAIEQRLNPFVVETSDDRQEWRTVYQKTDVSLIGGIDGRPLIHRAAPGTAGRYVRIRLLRREFLHLDEVEIYGVLPSM